MNQQLELPHFRLAQRVPMNQGGTGSLYLLCGGGHARGHHDLRL
jgi:hypothetical protein